MKTTYEDFKKALKIVNDYKNEIESHYKEVERKHKEINRFASVTKETKLMDIEYLEVRTLNCLRSGDYLDRETKVKDFESVKISELKRLRNFGSKSLQEVKEICFYAGVSLLP